MREILFRGKDNGVLNNQWQFGSVDFTNEMFPQIIRHDRFGNKMYIPVDLDTVGQFTGLTDKNGKKIFEGDILSVSVNEMAYPEEGSIEEDVLGRRKIPTGNKIRTVWSVEHKIRSNTGSTFFVYGKDRRFNRVLTGNTVYNAEAEVIGNIHDNPELLGGKEDGK